MSEELIDKAELEAALEEAPEVEIEEAEENEYSEIELEAMEKGWHPEGVEGKPNLSAEEFIRNESFFKEIHKLKRELKKNSEVVDALKTHNKQTAQKAYDKAVRDLKAEKKLAAKEEDLERVIEIDDQLDELQQVKKEADAAEPVVQPGLTEEDFRVAYQEFVTENVWYGRRPEMTADAEAIYDLYSRKNPNALPEDRFEHVKAEMRKQYPDDFGNQNRRKAAAVSTPSKSGTPTKAKKYSLNDVDEADRAIANTLIRSGTMTEEEYLADYFQK